MCVASLWPNLWSFLLAPFAEHLDHLGKAAMAGFLGLDENWKSNSEEMVVKSVGCAQDQSAGYSVAAAAAATSAEIVSSSVPQNNALHMRSGLG